VARLGNWPFGCLPIRCFLILCALCDLLFQTFCLFVFLIHTRAVGWPEAWHVRQSSTSGSRPTLAVSMLAVRPRGRRI
jgi:hypothetical protein